MATDAEIDAVYDEIDDLCCASAWSKIDSILDAIDIAATDTDILLSYLVTTGWAKSNLSRRDDYVLRTVEEFKRRGVDERVWTGLTAKSP